MFASIMTVQLPPFFQNCSASESLHSKSFLIVEIICRSDRLIIYLTLLYDQRLRVNNANISTYGVAWIEVVGYAPPFYQMIQCHLQMFDSISW